MPTLMFPSSSRPKQNTTGCGERRAVMKNDGRQPEIISRWTHRYRAISDNAKVNGVSFHLEGIHRPDAGKGTLTPHRSQLNAEAHACQSTRNVIRLSDCS